MKNLLLKSTVLACGALIATSAQAQEGEFYIGAFGGLGSTGSQAVEQVGVAHKSFSGDGKYEGNYYTYDLPVDVDGRNRAQTAQLFGGQIGYEWATQSKLKPAIEIEGVYLGADQEANLANPDDEVPTNVAVIARGAKRTAVGYELAMAEHHGTIDAGVHNFNNTSKVRAALFMLNGVLSYKAESWFAPYIGVGVGFAAVNLRDAVSLQTGPGGVEHTGGNTVPVNHFNSRDSANDFALVAQAKTGVRFHLTGKASLFAEYRYIRLASTEYTFGSTVYPDHAATDAWVFRNGSVNLHNGIVGLRVGF